MVRYLYPPLVFSFLEGLMFFQQMHVPLVMCGALGFSHGGLKMDRKKKTIKIDRVFRGTPVSGGIYLLSWVIFAIFLHILHDAYFCAVLSQSCLTLCDPIDCCPRALLSMGILQTRILQWVAISFSRGFSQPRGRTQVSHIAGRFFSSWSAREAQCLFNLTQFFVLGEGLLLLFS